MVPQSILFEAIVFGSLSYHHLQKVFLSLYLPALKGSFKSSLVEILLPSNVFGKMLAILFYFINPRVAALFILRPTSPERLSWSLSLRNFPLVPSGGQSGGCSIKNKT